MTSPMRRRMLCVWISLTVKETEALQIVVLRQSSKQWRGKGPADTAVRGVPLVGGDPNLDSIIICSVMFRTRCRSSNRRQCSGSLLWDPGVTLPVKGASLDYPVVGASGNRVEWGARPAIYVTGTKFVFKNLVTVKRLQLIPKKCLIIQLNERCGWPRVQK